MAAEELLIGAAIPGSVESAHRSLPFPSSVAESEVLQGHRGSWNVANAGDLYRFQGELHV
jgi:hypothetical protein